MKQNLTIDDLTMEAYENLDKIRILSRLSSFAIVNEADNIQEGSFELIFKCIEEYSWQVSEVVETLGNRCASNVCQNDAGEAEDVTPNRPCGIACGQECPHYRGVCRKDKIFIKKYK